MTTSNQAFVSLPCGTKKLVNDLTSNDKYNLADRLVKNEVLLNVSYMVHEVLPLTQYDGCIYEELESIAFEESEPLDAKRECQLLGWDCAGDMSPSRLYEFCAKMGLNHIEEIQGYSDKDCTFVNSAINPEYYDNVDSWDELAEIIDVDLEVEPMEALEYWAVTNWLASKLTNTVETLGMTIWGRTCSGQAIALDSDIQDLAVELATFEA